MKFIQFAFIATFMLCCGSLRAQLVTIPDGQFVNWLQNNYPTCMSGNQLDTTCADILNAHAVDCGSNYIQNLEGIQYFTSLDSLYCSAGSLTTVPSFPTTLKLINLSNNQLVSIPTLPPNLEQLSLNNNQPLASLPALPNTLVNLDCFGASLTSLPALPASLKVLDCEVNQITSLPPLPDSLIVLGVSMNPLGSLPTLPSQLYQLYCGSCQLTQLPTLPPTLTILSALDNMLTSIPPLPAVMWDVDVSLNPLLTCLPPVYEVYNYMNISGTAITCLPNVISHPGSWPQIDTLPLCGLYGSGCAVGWNVAGNAYLDNNSNCVNDVTESKLHNIKAMLFHNGTLTQQMYTNSYGMYSFDTDLSGNYTVKFDSSDIPFTITCPANNLYNVDVTVGDSLDDGGDFGMVCNPGYDIGVNGIVRSAGLFFPDDTATVRIFAGEMANYFGATCNTSGLSGTVQAVFSGPVDYAGSIGLLTPSSVSGNTITWNITDFSQVDFNLAFRILLHTNTTAVSGNQICFDVTVNAAGTDYNPINNSLNHCFTVVNSFDPNEKESSPHETALPGGWISYTIYFQNTGDAAAHNILVMDQLDANLDWSTFQLNGTSHEAVTQVVENGLVKFTFLNIMLPDSNSNEPGSHGWIQYRIKAIDNLALNTTIDNNASIYFDFNAPIVTNTTHNTYLLSSVETSTKSFELNVYPNPASQFVEVSYTSLNEESNIIISDVFGRRMSEQLLKNEGTDRIDISKLSQGMYRVELWNNNNVLAVKKLVVIR